VEVELKVGEVKMALKDGKERWRMRMKSLKVAGWMS